MVIDSGAGGYDVKMEWRTGPELAFKSSKYAKKLGSSIPPDLSFYFNVDNVEQSLDLSRNASIYKGMLNGGPLIGFFREGTADSTLIRF
jgi:hypothetical protein